MDQPDVEAPAAAERARLRAYLLLTFTAFLWGCNAVAGRWAVGQVSPQVLTTLRWAIGFAVLALFAGRRAVSERQALARRWRYVLAMGAVGYTAFASLFYLAGNYTSAVNVALFQGAIPVLVLVMNFLARGVPVGLGQSLGVCVTLAGAAVAATHGDWNVLRTLSFNQGDLIMLVACLFYAGYTVALAARPKVDGVAFFTAMAAAAFLTSLPPLAAEWALGRLIWPTPWGWAIVAFVAVGPTLVAQLFFMRGVELIGPNRAGLFVNLVPVFGALLAVLVAREPFGPGEALALALVLGGILIAERTGRRKA
ncbi:DMT family transporter [Methylobacterium organophilum]|uniref:DMT family transporter n=1 Tax=Methylobacterium organophilum TaxID=410 RepID=UPI003B84942B